MEPIEAVGETRARLLALVRGDARSVNELAGSLGITDNAVRTHVAGLERDGLVRQAGSQRETGGKPARLYELTPAGEELFPKAYALALAALVGLLKEEDGAEGVDRLRRAGRRLGARAPGAGGPDQSEAEARVSEAAFLLESLGGAVEMVSVPDGWELRSAGCPLSAAVTSVPEVCVIAESLVAEATGLDVTERCRRGERPRCVFTVSAPRTP